MEISSNHKSTFSFGKIASLLFIIVLLYITQPLLVPLLYGFFIAIILYPLCRRLENLGVNRHVATTIALTLLVLLFSALVLIMIYQYRLFSKDLPLILEKMQPLWHKLAQWLNSKAGFNIDESAPMLQNLVSLSGDSFGPLIRTSLSNVFSTAFNILIIPVYTALILSNRRRLMSFFTGLSGQKNQEKSQRIMLKVVSIYSKYIKGMLMVYLIVGILNSVGLLILGVKYAILFGMITAIMTIIPYLGIILSSLLPISVAWLTTDSLYYPLGVVLVFSIVQYLEGNFIYPWIVGKKVNVNILVSIVSVIAGGLLWGMSGMVLVLPMVAVLKIVADEIEDWKILAIMLGDKG
jgi:predicted PurR-regulated permease PerM